MNIRPVSGAWALVLAVAHTVTFLIGRRIGRYNVADVAWGVGHVVDPPSDIVADSAIAGDERRRVIECLGALTDAQRHCIEMAYYGGLTYVEVSQRLSANLSTIKSRMRDALRGLRNCLGAP